jgi:tRNA-splicing ligase RtcB
MKDKLKQLSPYKWLISKSLISRMRVDAIFYANDWVFSNVEDSAIQQLTNVASLPGVIEPVIGMPDMHWGYGLPMGAVGVFDKNDGVISCGCTGFDINCGIHMLTTNLCFEEVKPHLNRLIDKLFKNIPCGVGAKSKLKVSRGELEEILVTGAKWAVKKGFGVEDDLIRIEENGCIKGGDPSCVSERALQRGAPQLGTLGAGNHFLEIQQVSHIYDKKVAEKFGIQREGQITIMVHCGSRGLGHQVATDYLEIHKRAAEKYGIKLPDPQLVCAPATSPEGERYFKAMKCAANYAFCNRQMIAHWVRESFSQVFEKKWEDLGIATIYDVCHNICKLEKHKVGGKIKEVYVHRKGATRAFPKGHNEVPKIYQEVGQPVLIAGSMGTASYILVGVEKTMEETFGSSCHGAGRQASRKKAIKSFRGEKVKKELEAQGKVVRATHPKILAEEAPLAYKDVDKVVETVDLAGISKKVARMVPVGIAKG